LLVSLVRSIQAAAQALPRPRPRLRNQVHPHCADRPPHVANPLGRPHVPMPVDEHVPASSHPASTAAGSQSSALAAPPWHDCVQCDETVPSVCLTRQHTSFAGQFSRISHCNATAVDAPRGHGDFVIKGRTSSCRAAKPDVLKLLVVPVCAATPGDDVVRVHRVQAAAAAHVGSPVTTGRARPLPHVTDHIL
jgi:hypothetical protein